MRHGIFMYYHGLWFIVHCDRRLTNTSLLHHRRETQKNPKLTVQEAYACYYDRLKQTQRWIKSESRERTWSGLVLKKKKKNPKKTFVLVKTMIFPYPTPKWFCCLKTKPHTELRMWTTLSAVWRFVRPPSAMTRRLHRPCSTRMWHFVPWKEIFKASIILDAITLPNKHNWMIH